MTAKKFSRRDFLQAACIIVVLAVIVSMQVLSAGASAPAAHSLQTVERLTNYASHTSDGRNMTVTSATGQQLKITAYGSYIVRVHSKRSGETFFADARYEMVDPASHAGMGGTLTIVDNGTSFTITTAATDGIRVVLQKNPLRVEFYGKNDNALLAREDATRSMSWGGTNNSIIRETFVPAASDEHFFKAGHGLYGRSPRLDRTGNIVSHNYGLQTAHID